MAAQMILSLVGVPASGVGVGVPCNYRVGCVGESGYLELLGLCALALRATGRGDIEIH